MTNGFGSGRPKTYGSYGSGSATLVLPHRILAETISETIKMSNFASEIRIFGTGHILRLSQNFYRIEYSCTVPGDNALHEGSLLHQAGEVSAAPVHPAKETIFVTLNSYIPYCIGIHVPVN